MRQKQKLPESPRTGTGRLFTIILVVWSGCMPVLLAENVITSGTSLRVSNGTTLTSVDKLTVKAGATLNNAGLLILKKNLVNENIAPSPVGAGTFEMAGSSMQTVTGQNIFQTLKVNNTSGVTIGGSTVVNETLMLTNGRLVLGDNHLLLGPLAAIAGIPSVSTMIIATSSGELRKEFAAGFLGSFTWPVGDDSGNIEYTPVTLSFTGGTFLSGNYTGISLANSKYPDPGIIGNYLNRYWNISQVGLTSFNCNAIFQYTGSDVVGDESVISCSRVNPQPWVTYALTNPGQHQLSANGIQSFGSFTGLKCSLPPANQILQNIIIPNGSGNCYDAIQALTLAGNGNSFIVESGGSVSIVAGLKILCMPGTKVNAGGYLHGYITTSNAYCGSTPNALVMSPVMDIQSQEDLLPAPRWVKIYPNPTSEIVNLELTQIDSSAEVVVDIYNMCGERLKTQTLHGVIRYQFNLSGHPEGMYLIHVQSGAKSEIAKVVKK